MDVPTMAPYLTAARVEAVERRLRHLNGSLLEVPVWEPHERGQNWLAVITVDGACPGGLGRRFLSRGKGDSFYLIEQLGLFDAVEFGADYYTYTGRKQPKRFYAIVVAVTATEIVVREYASGALACVAAQEARTSTADKLRALEEARAAHLERASKLDEEIAALKGETDGSV